MTPHSLQFVVVLEVEAPASPVPGARITGSQADVPDAEVVVQADRVGQALRSNEVPSERRVHTEMLMLGGLPVEPQQPLYFGDRRVVRDDPSGEQDLMPRGR